MSEFHPDLKLARFIPTPGGGERLARVVRRFKVPAARVPDDMSVENVTVPGRNGGPAVRLRFYRPRAITGVTPSLLWMHGGGYFMGNVEQDDRRSMTIARSLGITVAALRAALFA
jgi:acetyl esterase/lipase